MKDASVAIHAVLAFAETVAFTRVDDVLVLNAQLGQLLGDLLGLDRRHAGIAVPVKDQQRRADAVEPVVGRGALHRLGDLVGEAVPVVAGHESSPRSISMTSPCATPSRTAASSASSASSSALAVEAARRTTRLRCLDPPHPPSASVVPGSKMHRPGSRTPLQACANIIER